LATKFIKPAKSAGAQIDLLFDRSDGVVSLCEIKFDSELCCRRQG
jgi:hypothetical protein